MMDFLEKFLTNKIYKIDKNGKLKKIFFIKGLKVKFKGKNSQLVFNENIPKFRKSLIVIGNNSSIVIGKTDFSFNEFSINDRGENNYCEIGNNFSCTGKTHISFAKENNLKVYIGNDCMFASEIMIRASDFHSIIDLETKTCTNHGKNIYIGNHCWLAKNTTILKGVIIVNNCVIGTGSIVTKSCLEENSIYAGSPAKKIKQGITWDRKCPETNITERNNY